MPSRSKTQAKTLVLKAALFGNRNRSRRSRQKGAQVVETSLILVPLFGLTFLLLDLSIGIWIHSTLQHAVREGVRYAITGQTISGKCQDDSIKAVVQANALGSLNSSDAADTVHVHFIDPAGGKSDNSYGNIVGVTVEGYPWVPWAPFHHSGASVKLYARAYDMMEPLPGALPCITKSE